MNNDSRKTGKVINKTNLILVGNIDYLLMLTTLILVLFGMTMVISANQHILIKNIAKQSEPGLVALYGLKQEGVFAILSICAMFVLANFNYNYLKVYAWPVYFISNFLLLLVPFIGKEVNGATRWINIAGVSVQPSEIAKFGLILVMALMLSKYKDSLKKINGYILFGIIIAIPFFLVVIGNGSTALIILMIGGVLIFTVTPHTKIFVTAGISLFSAILVYLMFFSKGFRSARFAAYLDPEADPLGKGFQPLQSLYSIASGGMFGLGLGQSRQTQGNYLPEAPNDFIFSVICEELGFFGASILLIMFIIYIWRGIKIAINSPDLFSCLLASGIVFLVAIQVVINVSVTTNTIPNTGIPLPFISSGGSSLLVFMSMTGILLNISRYSKA